jgi:hypothetical protein
VDVGFSNCSLTTFFKTQDLHSRNSLLQICDLILFDASDIHERFEKPFTIPVSRIGKGPSGPTYAVFPMNLIVCSNQVVAVRSKSPTLELSFLSARAEDIAYPNFPSSPRSLLPLARQCIHRYLHPRLHHLRCLIGKAYFRNLSGGPQ